MKRSPSRSTGRRVLAVTAILIMGVLVSATPQAVATSASEITADANTVVLDHFNGSTAGTAFGTLDYATSREGLGSAGVFGSNYVRYDFPGWGTGPGTIEMWLHPNTLSDSLFTGLMDWNWYVSTSYPSSGHVLHMQIIPTGTDRPPYYPVVSFWPGGQADGNTTIPVGEWTHLAVSWGASGPKVYVNGVQSTAQAWAGAPSMSGTTHAYLNYWGVPASTMSAFSGLIDELHISNVQRTDAEIAAHAQALYDFTGYFAPVDNPPTVNVIKAGSAVPVKFSLDGDHGLNVIADGYPRSYPIACDTGTGTDLLEETATPGASGLQYDPIQDQYTYIWKTQKSWSGCRALAIMLDDGSTHVAHFRLR